MLERMAYVRQVINEGLSQRAQAGIKVRQPLSNVTVGGLDASLGEHVEELSPVILEELNVKELVHASADKDAVKLDLTVTPKLKREGLVREAVRLVQNSRKKAGLSVDDRIELSLLTKDKELTKALKEHADTIKQETLATSLNASEPTQYVSEVKVEDAVLEIKLGKTGK